jgi:formylglycine-generating enzyme required for sulfatase activity
VTWNDAQAFCVWLSRKEKLTYRLPTEAEWEYACRAGGAGAYGNDAVIDRARANVRGTQTPPAGSYPPNAWGLYDMSGNAWEWTSDNDAPYPGVTAPQRPAFAPDREIIRGGSWRFDADSARCALRYTHRPQGQRPQPRLSPRARRVTVNCQLPTANSQRATRA